VVEGAPSGRLTAITGTVEATRCLGRWCSVEVKLREQTPWFGYYSGASGRRDQEPGLAPGDRATIWVDEDEWAAGAGSDRRLTI
jgi:hypothetical protein